MPRLLLPALVVALAALALPQPAQAAFFHGETQRGHEVTLTTDDRARALYATVSWRVRCRGRFFVARSLTPFEPDRATAGPGEFSAVSADAATGSDQSFARFEAAITGRRHVKRGRPGGEQWTGTFALTLTLYRDDEVEGRCRTRTQRWRAWREGYGVGTWRMTSEPGDYIGDGASYAYDRRNATISAIGDRRHVTARVQARDGAYWDAEFAAPKGQRLRRGARFTATRRYPFNDDAPGLDVTGQHRGCNTSSGEFTVTRATFDRRGRMRSFAATFVQHCESGAPALRGSISYRSHPR